MELVPLGQTGLSVTRIGLGMAALGRPGYINLGHNEDLNHNYDEQVMEAQSHEVMDAAWAVGVRYFDTARSYGLGELFLGNWLKARNFADDTPTISSKWGYTYTADWKIEADKHEVKDHSLPVLNRQWEETKETLGDFLDLYQIHSATLDSGVLENSQVLNRLAELKNEGVLIGLSLSGANQPETLAKALSVHIDGKKLFDTVQATYNLLETSAEPMLRQAHEEGLGVIIKEALANGRLTSRNDDSQFAKQFQILSQEAKKLNSTIDALAIAGVLAQPWVDTVLSGAARIAHLHSNLKALEINWDDNLSDRISVIRESPQTYWNIRKSLVWN
ncbi:MAG: aldo/keto reductase [Bacteroidia bacterium]